MKLSEEPAFNNWNIVKDDWITTDVPIDEQRAFFREDMFQATYELNANQIVIDLGWYGEDVDFGNFKCYVIKNANWDEPLFMLEDNNHIVIDNIAKSLAILIKEIHSCYIGNYTPNGD